MSGSLRITCPISRTWWKYNLNGCICDMVTLFTRSSTRLLGAEWLAFRRLYTAVSGLRVRLKISISPFRICNLASEKSTLYRLSLLFRTMLFTFFANIGDQYWFTNRARISTSAISEPMVISVIFCHLFSLAFISLVSACCYGQLIQHFPQFVIF